MAKSSYTPQMPGHYAKCEFTTTTQHVRFTQQDMEELQALGQFMRPKTVGRVGRSAAVVDFKGHKVHFGATLVWLELPNEPVDQILATEQNDGWYWVWGTLVGPSRGDLYLKV